MAHYELYICLTKATYESAVPSVLQPKLGWDEYTYKDVDKTGTRMVQLTVSHDNSTKAEIKTYMDTYSIEYNSGDTKQDLIDKTMIWQLENGIPSEEESYTYTESVVDTTTTITPTWKESAFKGKLGAPRVKPDGSLVIVKGEFSMLTGELSAMKDLGNDMDYPNNSILTKSEAQTLVRTWDVED